MKRNDLLEVKIRNPRLARGFIRREALLLRLKESRERIVVFHGTMGFGKTMLMDSYGMEGTCRSLWYHLGRQDNELGVFVRYLRLAMETAFPGAELWEPEEADAERISETIVRLLGMLPEGQTLILMLDDFQEIQENEICDFLDRLLKDTPPDFRLFLTTRGALPSFVLRYLLEGETAVFADRDLAFSREETYRLLRAGEPGETGTETAETIFSYTEGWPAGVMFFYLYIKQRRTPASRGKMMEICREFMVHDYIMYELFRKLPFEVQDFLKKTSVLEYLDRHICNEVAQVRNASGQLNYLVQENLFIQKLEGDGEVYRYHSLFRDFLRSQLTAEELEETGERAALFCLRNGQKQQALEYAMDSGAKRTVELILEKTGFYFLEEGRSMLLEGALDWCRERSAEASPKLMALGGLLELKEGRKENGLLEIKKALSQLREEKDRTVCGQVLNMTVQSMARDRDFSGAEELLKAEELETAEGTADWYEILSARITMNFFMGRVAAAGQVFERMMGFREKSLIKGARERERTEKLKKSAVRLFSAWRGEEFQEDEEDAQRAALLSDMQGLWSMYRALETGKPPEGEDSGPGSGSWIQAESRMLSGLFFYRRGERKKGMEEIQRAFAEFCSQGIRRCHLRQELQKECKEIFLLGERQPDGEEPPVHLFVNCFGDFGIRVMETGDEIKWRTSRAKTCMAYLFHVGKPVSREQILEALWQDVDDLPGNEVAALHNIFSTVRKSLAPYGMEELIRYENKKYSLRSEWLFSFREHMDQFAVLAELSNEEAAVRRCGTADLYDGPYLKDIDAPWCVDVREYYERRMEKGFHMLGRVFLEEGDYGNALHYLKRAEEIDPCREEIHLDVMRCLEEQGDRNRLRSYYEELKAGYPELAGQDLPDAVKEQYRQSAERLRARRGGTYGGQLSETDGSSRIL